MAPGSITRILTITGAGPAKGCGARSRRKAFAWRAWKRLSGRSPGPPCFVVWLQRTCFFPKAARVRTPFARYALIASANLPLSLAAMFAFVDLGGVSVPLATPLVTVLLVLFNFLGGRWALKVAGPLWRT